MSDNSKFWLVAVLVGLVLVVGLGGKFVINKVADCVIQKLQKDYSPSPYGPGLDPDKIDAEKLRQPKP